VLADLAITERQKRVLIDVYQSFVKENEKDGAPAQTESGSDEPQPAPGEPTSGDIYPPTTGNTYPPTTHDHIPNEGEQK